jgi:hypothetical protein
VLCGILLHKHILVNYSTKLKEKSKIFEGVTQVTRGNRLAKKKSPKSHDTVPLKSRFFKGTILKKGCTEVCK